jgi:hypothetical protein
VNHGGHRDILHKTFEDVKDKNIIAMDRRIKKIPQRAKD